MRKYTILFVLTLLVVMLVGCKVIDNVTDTLEVAGYDVYKNDYTGNDFNTYDVYDGETRVAIIYEFSTFRKARDYYDLMELQNVEDGRTWVIHNQLIIGAYDEDVIHLIVN